MVFVPLEPVDVAGTRLLGRIIAAVGLQYVVPRIHLVAKPDGFNKLLAVAEDPLARNHVTCLSYAAGLPRSGGLPRVEGGDWEKGIVGTQHAGALEEVQNRGSTSAWNQLPKRYLPRPLTVAPHCLPYPTRRDSQQACSEYQSYLAEQFRQKKTAVYEEAIVRAMKKLPYLESIIISCDRGNTNNFCTAFEAGVRGDFREDSKMANSLVASQLGFLLSTVEKAGLQIGKLVCGSLNQVFVSSSLERLTVMGRSIRTRRTPLPIPEALDPHSAVESERGSTSTGPINFNLISPRLGSLTFGFDRDLLIVPPDPKTNALDFHWWWLSTVTLTKMATDPQTLIRFCGRHAPTLRDFSLTDMTLQTGLWSTTLFEMRQRLEVHRMTFAGIIESSWGSIGI